MEKICLEVSCAFGDANDHEWVPSTHGVRDVKREMEMWVE